ncbi:ADP-ribosylglycohydrolase family protein [Ideonella sp. YS5]|uniref:ADP-ribosylglycohydrolase family protein n=1 Tax=Ideonella sp. YS5 TaxID=3453714 RepID=UPI003EEB742C
MEISLVDRYRGCLLGLACGDAVGTAVEFAERGSFPLVTDMLGGGPFDLPAGAWTDDTSMALCLATSLLHCEGFDARDQMNRYINWWQWGYLSSTGDCFDIGMTVCRALQRYQVTGDPMAGSIDPSTAGNGSLMRLAPVVLAFRADRAEARRHARLSSATTHSAPEALDCCDLFSQVLMNALEGQSREELLICAGADFASERVNELARRTYLNKEVRQIRGSGYCVESLEAALWCFARSHSFKEAVLSAVNLGEDADTTAAIVGQLAGAHFGVQGIPRDWLECLCMRDEIDRLAVGLAELRGSCR